MLKITFEYKDEYTNGKRAKQTCIMSSVRECIKTYGLGVDCDYRIVSVEEVYDAYNLLSGNEKRALKQAVKNCGITLEEEDIAKYYAKNPEILSINKCRNGRDVAWFVWDSDAGIESCVYIDSMEELSQEEVEEQLL